MRLLLAIACCLPVAGLAAEATTLATLRNTNVYAAQTDAAGNIYIAGFQGTYVKANPFVAKLSPSGQTLYSTTFGVDGFGIAWGIALDAAGAAYVFGTTNSPDFPVTSDALQTTFQAAQVQGFAAKLDANGKVVYSTFVGGSSGITPGSYSAPGLNSIVVDAAGDAILTGQASGQTEGTSFVMTLDPTGAKILSEIRGVGGAVALDAQGSVYVAGVAIGNGIGSVPVTPGAFQTSVTDLCPRLGGIGADCYQQYVAKLSPDLTQIVYATYLDGSYGALPRAITVDVQGNVTVVGTTNSPDYPTTANASQPKDTANAPGLPPFSPACFMSLCGLPPATGYLTRLNASGSALVYSSFFGGSQTDTIGFAAFTPGAVYLSGRASSPDLPGLGPQQCLPALPQTYATSLSADGIQVTASATASGTVIGYDAAAGMLLAWTGTDLVEFPPPAPVGPIACILDSADLQPVTSIAPGELLSIFGANLASNATIPAPGDFPTALGGVSVAANGIPSPLLYAGLQQVNFQAPFELAGSEHANLLVSTTPSNASAPVALLVGASNPTAFLNPAVTDCLPGPVPLALNADGTVNSCHNAALAGSVVTLFLNGLGATSGSNVTVTATNAIAVVSASALPGAISGVWVVTIQLPAGQSGRIGVSLTVGGVPVRDTNLGVWAVMP